MRTVFGTQVATSLAPVVAEPAEAPARAGLVSTQLLGMALCRYILVLDPVAALGVEELVAASPHHPALSDRVPQGVIKG